MVVGSAGIAAAAVAIAGLCAAVASSAVEHSALTGHQIDRYGYLAHLDRQGVGYPSADEAVGWGRQVCEALHARVPLIQVGRQVMGLGFEPLQAAHIVNAAGRMCPDTVEYVRDQMNGLRRVDTDPAAVA